MCAKLGIALLHSRPYQPAGKGKIERFFRTLRAAVLAHLTAEATESLQTLNRTLWAWVEGEYHQSPHRGLDGRTPLDQWALAGHNVRYPVPGLDLDDLFLFEAKCRVMKDRTVSLHGRLYEVDAVLVGQTVTLRYDPDAAPARPIEVVHDAKPAGLATRLDAYAKHPRQAPPTLLPAPLRHPAVAALALAPGDAKPQGEEVMYLCHFALTRLPFETPAHTDELFESNARREAEARLHHLIELKGIGLLTGEVGSGKTTVCRHIASALHPGLYRVGYVSLTTVRRRPPIITTKPPDSALSGSTIWRSTAAFRSRITHRSWERLHHHRRSLTSGLVTKA